MPIFNCLGEGTAAVPVWRPSLHVCFFFFLLFPDVSVSLCNCILCESGSSRARQHATGQVSLVCFYSLCKAFLSAGPKILPSLLNPLSPWVELFDALLSSFGVALVHRRRQGAFLNAGSP